MQTRARRASVPDVSPEDRALVWFTRNVRVADHAGLLAASRARCATAAILVIDPKRQRAASAASAAMAAEKLRDSLRSKGMDLIVRVGRAEEVVLQMVRELRADVVLVEDDVESTWREAIESVKDGEVRIRTWKSPLREGSIALEYPIAEEGSDVPENQNEGQQLVVEAWRALEEGNAGGMEQTISKVEGMALWSRNELSKEESGLHQAERWMQQNFRMSGHGAVRWTRPPLPVPEMFSKINVEAAGVQLGSIPSAEEILEAIAVAQEVHPSLRRLQEERLEEAAGHEAVRLAIASGAEEALQEYLKGYENGDTFREREGWLGLLKELVQREESQRRGAALASAFADAFELGLLSPRMLYAATQKQLRKVGEGRVRDISHWTMAARAELSKKPLHTALLAAEAQNFHLWLAEEDARRGERVPGAMSRWWRWKGRLCHYNMALPHPESCDHDQITSASKSRDPALVFVHGFGASADHFRRNMKDLADEGFKVYALTMPGFGRSEKPPDFAYSQHVWVNCLKDFLLEVVKEPAVVVGNSIGGYISAQLAAECPEAILGLGLINTAGKIGNQSADTKEKPKPNDLVVVTASLTLLWYLERNIKATLKRCYPQNPDGADAWLAEEIFRAACDPGSLRVFSSAFYLPAPVPLNVLIQDMYKGPTLVLQGVNDPLNDAKSRARQLGELCDNVEVELLEAGHCPHDEVPLAVNQALGKWIRRLGTDRTQTIENVTTSLHVE